MFDLGAPCPSGLQLTKTVGREARQSRQTSGDYLSRGTLLGDSHGGTLGGLSGKLSGDSRGNSGGLSGDSRGSSGGLSGKLWVGGLSEDTPGDSGSQPS